MYRTNTLKVWEVCESAWVWHVLYATFDSYSGYGRGTSQLIMFNRLITLKRQCLSLCRQFRLALPFFLCLSVKGIYQFKCFTTPTVFQQSREHGEREFKDIFLGVLCCVKNTKM